MSARVGVGHRRGHVPNYESYRLWQDGRCATVDAPGEKRRIRQALEAEYGSVYFSG